MPPPVPLDPIVIVGWKVWYGDRHTIKSSDAAWAFCRDDNVQVLMLVTRGDNGKLYGHFIAGTHDPSIYTIPGSDHVKTGAWLSDAAFEEIRIAAMEAPLEI